MVLKLRLSRVSTPGGAKRHHPRYNIVLAHARTARDSKPLEVLGTYNPIPELPVGAEPGARKQKDIKIDVARVKYWLGVGAQPSDTVWRLLSMIGLLEPKYLPTGPQTTNALKAARFPVHHLPAQRQEDRDQKFQQRVPTIVQELASYQALALADASGLDAHITFTKFLELKREYPSKSNEEIFELRKNAWEQLEDSREARKKYNAPAVSVQRVLGRQGWKEGVQRRVMLDTAGEFKVMLRERGDWPVAAERLQKDEAAV
ncbi:ribosomal protein S16 [Teratosphaeria destructans]|uniref:Ribosomal protein S16 n=1 Tax=Teratosphaeria destructans TaxID=418781 RepID=A0A9W7W5A0_9PEZI|nr:ribosomal protein S16 [Teratosphaeria destructans]